MKIAAIVFLCTFYIYFPCKAQDSVRINTGAPPNWAPIEHKNAPYYYLPDLESYYYVPTRQFIYKELNKWVYRNSVPSKFRNFDLYSCYKVPLYKEKAYHNFEKDRYAFSKFKNSKGKQVNIRSSEKKFLEASDSNFKNKYYPRKGSFGYNQPTF